MGLKTEFAKYASTFLASTVIAAGGVTTINTITPDVNITETSSSVSNRSVMKSKSTSVVVEKVEKSQEPADPNSPSQQSAGQGANGTHGTNGTIGNFDGSLNDYFVEETTTAGRIVDSKTLQSIGVGIYSGLPWPSETGGQQVAYRLNVKRAWDEVCDILGYDSTNVKLTVASDGYCKTTKKIDGVPSMSAALPQSLSMCYAKIEDDYVVSGVGENTRAPKAAAIVTRGEGTYYIPLHSQEDAKGHIWPLGFCQTFLSNGPRVNGEHGLFEFNTDNGHIVGIPTPSRTSEVQNWYSRVTYDGHSVYPQMCLEIQAENMQALKREGYEFKGYVTWKVEGVQSD